MNSKYAYKHNNIDELETAMWAISNMKDFKLDVNDFERAQELIVVLQQFCRVSLTLNAKKEYAETFRESYEKMYEHLRDCRNIVGSIINDETCESCDEEVDS